MFTRRWLLCVVMFGCLPATAAAIPLRINLPGGSGEFAVPVAGGIPFPHGALASEENVRLLGADNIEVPCQATRLAVWPDGSVKWVLIDAVIVAKDGAELSLEYGPGVKRANIGDPVLAKLQGDDAVIQGGGVAALIRKIGNGFVDALSIDGKEYIKANQPSRLYIETLRIKDGTSGEALPVNTCVCRDPNALLDVGKVEISEVTIESPGPIRATVLLRGNILLAHFGETLPEIVKKRDPPGRMPFSMRVSFFKGTRIVHGQHQIVFSGEPDCDFIGRWGVELPDQAAGQSHLILASGAELERHVVCQGLAAQRLCADSIQEGFALIRQGWENRPCAITAERGSAWLDFWPRAAGFWDLRRYAREWAVGESGDTRNTADIERYAKYAARGMAKSHEFVSDFDNGHNATAFARRALLVASPGWYAQSQALGAYDPPQAGAEFEQLDDAIHRRLDYYIFAQDLYQWYGKLTYGFWQYRYGQVHRNDRWDCDYGRWGWSLNDGAGRTGHVLMLEFLRTLDRRYFDAGEAFGRINYDTNMIHTVQHLEGARNWWLAAGCSHRHNVQPFGCPYIGMRGSYPVGQRIFYLLTGDGVIKDGLDLVSETCFRYAQGESSRLCASGDSDGQGSAANALLWKYESTGERKYLEACRTVLDKSGLIPPKDLKDLGYGPAFGVFNAAGEYAELSGDKDFQARIVALAKLGADKEDHK